jgi:hypothetical protein
MHQAALMELWYLDLVASQPGLPALPDSSKSIFYILVFELQVNVLNVVLTAAGDDPVVDYGRFL